MRSAALPPAVGLASLTGAAKAQQVQRREPIPKEERKPQAELDRKFTDMDWKIRRVKTENGCYEVHGTDEKGGKVEVFFDPKTFDRVVAEKK